MKKVSAVLFFVFLALGAFTSNAQVFELTPTYGYQFGSKLNYGSNYLKVNDSGFFGLTAGFEARRDYMIEVTYYNMGTDLLIRDRILSPNESKLADLNVDWFMVGGTRYFTNGNIKPFIGGQLGLSIYSPKNENRDIVNRSLDSATYFSFGFKGGVVIMLTESIGLNFQGNLLFPVEWGGVYVGIGTGGPSTGVSAGSTIIMGGFSGGLVFRFGA
ncbi:hypothetical protein [Robiginitalea aurantiaca]|nr:hypothetical protein [Robiginitalea aurantiaca]